MPFYSIDLSFLSYRISCFINISLPSLVVYAATSICFFFMFNDILNVGIKAI